MKNFKVHLLVAALLTSASVYAQDTTTTTTTNGSLKVDNNGAVSQPNGTSSTTTSTATSNSTTANGTDNADVDARVVQTHPTDQIPTPQEDAIITKSIQNKIKESKTLSHTNVNVSTNQGVVTLSGNVDSDSEASGIVELAQTIVGVRDVDTANLTVKESKQPFADMMITAKVKGLFIREELFGEKDIAAMNTKVETRNGIVYLTGIVDNKEQIENAVKIVQGVKGVKKVEYNVRKVVTQNANNDMNMNNNSNQNNHTQDNAISGTTNGNATSSSTTSTTSTDNNTGNTTSTY